MTVRARYVGSDPDAAVTQNTTYLHRRDGTITISEDIRIPKQLEDLPRVGLAFEVAAALEQLVWLGRGPHETYPDRRRGAAFGRWESTVTDQYVPYVVPQEHGGHSDTRWFALHDGAGHGLRIGASAPFHFSVGHFTAGDLLAARHAVELRPRPEIFVHVDVAHRGLGTLSCGPDTLPEYRVGPGRYRFTWTMRPFTDLADATRRDR
jgi:beta-galactosidase